MSCRSLVLKLGRVMTLHWTSIYTEMLEKRYHISVIRDYRYINTNSCLIND